MTRRIKLCLSTALFWSLMTGLAGCNLPMDVPTTPTLELTVVYQTISAVLTPSPATQTGTRSPISTPTPATDQTAQSQLDAEASLPALTAAVSTTIIPTISGICDLAAAGTPIDITIPDNTVIEPGQSFTKIWRLQNVGSCTWTTRYAAAFFYGDRMDAPESIFLNESVPPGQTVEIAIEMTAPLTPGIYQGNWKLRNENGELFGIGPDGSSPFWVRIIVAEPTSNTPSPTALPSPTSTPTSTPSPTPTITATPPIQAAGALTLVPADSLDLDTALLNTGSADDLVYQAGTGGFHWLSPRAGVLLGVFSGTLPEPDDCQQASMSSAPIAMESLSPGVYLCYQTNQGYIGRALLVELDLTDFSLVLEILTWALP